VAFRGRERKPLRAKFESHLGAFEHSNSKFGNSVRTLLGGRRRRQCLLAKP
jgi:hypothetical protein